jgi:DNA modification methylase
MGVQIINASVLDGLRQLPDESVHCVVTSPPYWGLRDYGAEGQIGLEPTPQEFVAKIVEVFQEVRRVLRKDGVCWLNLGDSYAAGKMGRDDEDEANLRRRFEAFGTGRPKAGRKGANGQQRSVPLGFKPKDLVGIPWMVAFALRADGWWLRSDIIWSKPNPMPESVTDRPTKAHEYVFLLTKSERYFYDAEAIKEDATYAGPNAPGSQASGQGFTRRAPEIRKRKNEALAKRQYAGFNDRWDAAERDGTAPLSRNKRSVWTIATAPFPEAHFATFPPELPEICIKAGCPVGGTVLDPFGGAGTTGLVADRLQRNCILIELNPEYAAMARRRIDGDRGGLLDLMESVA